MSGPGISDRGGATGRRRRFRAAGAWAPALILSLLAVRGLTAADPEPPPGGDAAPLLPPVIELPSQPKEPEPPPPGPAVKPPIGPGKAEPIFPEVTPKEVDEAIARGIAWLKAKQKSDGSFGATSPGPAYGRPNEKVNVYHNRPGIAALALLALLKSDVPPKDPAITKGFQFLNSYFTEKNNQVTTYDMGIALMAIEAMYESLVKDRLAQQGKQILERPGDFKEPRYTPSAHDQQFCMELVNRLYRAQSREGGWRYGERFRVVGSEEDISATQIVMLGLKSASRMKLPVNSAVVRRAMGFVMRSQEADGPKVLRKPDAKPADRGTYASLGEDRARGWAYEKKSDVPGELVPCGSMTTAGIATILICKSILGTQLSTKESADADRCIWDGFAWLSQNWSVVKNPGSIPRPHMMYYLYGIERVGTLGLYRKIVTHDWYNEGAYVITRIQQPDGSWNTRSEADPCDVIDTCLALLFLRRSTVPIGDVLAPRVFTPR